MAEDAKRISQEVKKVDQGGGSEDSFGQRLVSVAPAFLPAQLDYSWVLRNGLMNKFLSALMFLSSAATGWLGSLNFYSVSAL